jgi:DNA-binding SARP family transcriptional activator
MVPYGRTCLLAAAVICFAAHAAGPSCAADEEALERLLARLGLVDLQIVHLEKSLEGQALTEPQRDKLAQKLADLYAEQLMESAGDPARYEKLVARVQELLARFPQANTAALQVMLLQADYNRAEGQVAEWIADRANQKSLTDARTLLEQIVPQLDDHQQQLTARVDAIAAEMDRMSDTDPDLTVKENEARRLQAVLARATYFSGWANYYLGLTREAGGATQFRRAAELFRKLLDVDGSDYSSQTAEDLSLEVIWRARGAIGLGLTEAALGNVEASRTVFQLLEQSAAPAEIQDQAPYWYVQGLLNAGRVDDARQFAEKKVAELTGAATQGKVSLCVALVRGGFSDPKAAADPSARELGMLGISGLAKLGQYDAAQQLLEKYNVTLEGESGFFLEWMQGRRLFAKAQDTKQADDYLAAAKIFEQALSQSDAASQTAAAGHCRYELGWCHYRAGDFETAARQFEQAITPLKSAAVADGGNAAWMAFVSYKQLAEKQPRFLTAAIDMLQTLKRDFPQHEHARNADYYIARLQRSAGSPVETIRNLQKIKPNEPNYLTSRFDLCVVLHQQWSEAETAGAKAAALESLRKAAEDYVKASGLRGDKERQLRVLLLVAAAALGTEPANESLAEDFLARAAPMAQNVPDASSAKADFHYRQMQLARVKDDPAGRLAHAQWLVEHAPGSAYDLAALIEVSRDVQRRLEAAPQAERGKLHEEAFAIYTRLVERLGDSPEVLQSQKNARVALSRLAEHAAATGRHEEAARRLAPLLQIDPKNQQYLRQAGLANFQAGRFAEALDAWRTLTLGLPRGSEEWLEAKYYQIASLEKTDRDEARKTLEQMQLLYPDTSSSTWGEKFAGLAQRLK